jgi:hypothetical protein
MGAKKLKYPKKPKATASLEVWERYTARCKEVDKINAQKEADAKKKAALIAKARK